MHTRNDSSLPRRRLHTRVKLVHNTIHAPRLHTREGGEAGLAGDRGRWGGRDAVNAPSKAAELLKRSVLGPAGTGVTVAASAVHSSASRDTRAHFYRLSATRFPTAPVQSSAPWRLRTRLVRALAVFAPLPRPPSVTTFALVYLFRVYACCMALRASRLSVLTCVVVFAALLSSCRNRHQRAQGAGVCLTPQYLTLCSDIACHSRVLATRGGCVRCVRGSAACVNIWV